MLELKVGAKVILLKNLDVDSGSINGSRTVLDFVDDSLAAAANHDNKSKPTKARSSSSSSSSAHTVDHDYLTGAALMTDMAAAVMAAVEVVAAVVEVPWARRPLVEFSTFGGVSLRRVMAREDFTIEAMGRVMATRSQFPIKLAWAISMYPLLSFLSSFLSPFISSFISFFVSFFSFLFSKSLFHLPEILILAPHPP